MKKQTWIVLFFTLSLSHEMQGQTVCKELRVWIDKLSIIDVYEQDITYTLYKDHFSQEVLENECGKLYRSKNTFQMEILGNLIIQDANLQVHIHEEDRMIAVSETTPMKATSFADVEKWIGLCKYAEKLKSKKNLTGYVFQFKDTYFTELSKAEIWINPQTGMLEELVLYYNQNHNIAATYHQPTYVRPRLHIVYTTSYPKANNFKKISYDKYITITNGKVRPKAMYKDWDIHILSPKI